MMKPVGNGGGISVAAQGTLCSNSYDLDFEQCYRNYAQNALSDRRKFSVDENMFAISERNGLHQQKGKYVKF